MDHVFITDSCGYTSFSFRSLRLVQAFWNAVDVPLLGKGNDHVSTWDEVLILHAGIVFDYLGPAGVCKLSLNVLKFSYDYVYNSPVIGENIIQLGNCSEDLFVFEDLVPFEAGEPLEAQIQDCLSLDLR